MVRKIGKKLVAILAILGMTMGNILLLGQEVYAAYEELESQGVGTNQKEVSFDAYYKEGNAKVHAATLSIGEQETLYVNIQVGGGYLTGGQIALESMNYEIVGEVEAGGKVKSINKETGIIELNDIEKNEEVEIAIPIQYSRKDKVEVGSLEKESTVSLTGTYVDNEGKEKEVKGSKQIATKWDAEGTAKIGQEVVKYIKTEEGVLIETKVTGGVEGNTVPVKSSNIELSVPEIEGKKADKVTVIGRSTKGSNGEDRAESFGEGNYVYDAEAGVVRITEENVADSEGKIAWEAGKDSYRVIYEYTGVEEAEARSINLEGNITIVSYTGREMTAESKQEGVVIEANGSLVSGEVEVGGNISKGYLYANNGENRSQYTSSMIVEVSKVGEESIVVGSGAEKVAEQVGEEVSYEIGTNMGYEKIELSKANVDNMLGETGKITVKNEAGTILGEITKETQANEAGKIEIAGNDASSITVEVEGVAKAGYLYIDSTKSFKGNTSYARDEIARMTGILTGVEVGGIRTEGRIGLEETSSKGRLEVSQANLSSIVRNEKVEIKGILETDSVDDELYKNPVIEFVLPKDVTGVELNSVNLLYSTELQVGGYEVTVDGEGRQVIRVSLAGEEKHYHAASEIGATVIVNANLIVNETATSKADSIIMRYSNENKGETKEISQGMNIVAPSGMIVMSSVEGEGLAVEAKEEEDGIGKIEVRGEAKRARVGMRIINNQDNTVEGVSVLGRIPNKEEEGSTFDTKLVRGIEGATVYYSDNAEADADINKAENGWSTEATENSKSYLIEVGEMGGKESREYSYEVEIPGGLEHNENSYGGYEVEYNNTANGGAELETEKTGRIGFTTGQGVVLEAKIASNVGDNQTVYPEQYITYEMTITNKGTTAIEGATATIPIPEGTTYMTYSAGGDEESDPGYQERPDINELTWQNINVAPNETVTNSIQVRVDPDVSIQEINAKYTVNVPEEEKGFESNTTTQIVGEKGLSILLESQKNEYAPLYLGDTFTYFITIRNLTNEDINNVKVVTPIPENTEFNQEQTAADQDEYYEMNSELQKPTYQYDEESKSITWDLGTIKPSAQSSAKNMLLLTVNVTQPEQITSAITPIVNKGAYVTWDNKTAIANTVTRELHIGLLKIEKSSPTENQYVKEGDPIEYNIKITNIGDDDTAFDFQDIVPDGVSFESATLTQKGETQETTLSPGDEYGAPLQMDIGESVDITLKGTVDELEDGESTKTITNQAIASGVQVGTQVSNEVVHYVEKSANGYRLSGVAWFDENKNGMRDDGEQLLSGIPVRAMNADTNQMVVDENGDTQISYTNDQGQYEITGLTQGNYILVFDYDQSQYSLTEYRKAGVEENRNNDVTLGTITENGEERRTGVTNTIAITESSQGNIDIGLVTASTFDFSLDKYVSKITVQDSKETKTYTYNESQLARVELYRKRITGANIVIEYTIRVTNEGNVAGYVRKIADYMPSELKFQSELNTNWYESNGELISNELANDLINPGETREIKLVLTKQMTDNGIGNVSNKAEIKETYNDYGLTDVDSVEGNKVDGEDDISKADVIIAVETGTTVLYIGITMVILVAIGVGAYFINKKVLNNEF